MILNARTTHVILIMHVPFNSIHLLVQTSHCDWGESLLGTGFETSDQRSLYLDSALSKLSRTSLDSDIPVSARRSLTKVGPRTPEGPAAPFPGHPGKGCPAPASEDEGGKN